MATAKTRAPRYVTAVGVAIWPKLVTPDEFKGSITYKTELSLPADAELFDAKGKSLGSMQLFLDETNSEVFARHAAANKGKKDKKGKAIVIVEADAPYRIDPDTGAFVPKFKLNASGTNRDGEAFTQKPALFDAKGKPFEGNDLWGGTKMKVSFEVVPYLMDSTRSAGISLRLKAVQIIELKAGGGAASADNYGFGEEEGYEQEDEAGDNGFGPPSEDGYEPDDSDIPADTSDGSDF